MDERLEKIRALQAGASALHSLALMELGTLQSTFDGPIPPSAEEACNDFVDRQNMHADTLMQMAEELMAENVEE